MTKELVKSENGHKIIKHARLGKHYSLSPLSPVLRIKMGFNMTPSLVILFLVLVVSSESATLEEKTTTVAPVDTTEGTTEAEPLKAAESEVSTDSASPTSTKSNPEDKKGDNDVNNDGEITLEDILLFGSLFGSDDDDAFDVNDRKPGDAINKDKSDDIATDSTIPVDSKLAAGSDGIRRQGDVNPSFPQNIKNSEIQYDDGNQDGRSSLPYSQTSQDFNRDNIQDEVVDLQLTEGGYNKPFTKIERPSSNNRFASLYDSSQPSEKMVQVPDRSSSRQQQGRQILPQAAYPIPPQFPFTPFRPMLPPLDSSRRNVLPINQVMPAPSGLINTPPDRYAEYRTAGFQPQFPGTETGVFANFGQDPNNAALFQTSQRNPFQDTSLLFQSAPQIQSQPILIDPSGNIPAQFQQDPFSAFNNFDSVDDSSRSNYAAFFGEPAGNPQFRVPNFFRPNLNRMNPFSSPPVTFLPTIPNSQGRLPAQLTGYIPPKDAQNQQNINDQQPETEASQEAKTTSTDSQEDGNAGSNNDQPPFGTRLQDKDDGDVYMRYPTIEAGYAVKENLPPQNKSGDDKINDKQAETGQRNFPGDDPYINALNLLQSNQRVNSSFGFPPPPPIFSDTPIDFGYRRPQNPIMVQYPDRNSDLPSFRRPNFNPGNPFDTLASLPDNNFGYLRGNTQRQGNQEVLDTPSCAKQNNVSFCFEDSEYPSDAILFSLNSNPLFMNQLTGSDPNSVQLVEKNASVPDQPTENYACPVDIKYGAPLRAKNMAGDWRIIVSLDGPNSFRQWARLEACKSLGEPCKYTDSKVKTTCVQKYSVQRFVVWSPIRGVYSDVFKLPVACSCQILDADLP